MRLDTIRATAVQNILIGFIVLLVIGLVGIVVTAQSILQAKHVQTDRALIDAELAQEELVKLQQLETIINKNRVTIEKTARIVAESQSYEFQDQVINDITSYARQFNIEITKFDFGPKPGSPSQGTGTTSSSQKTKVSIQLGNNISYEDFLRFLKAIENNVTKMQLTGMRLQPSETNPTAIVGPTIELEVFIR